MSRPPEITLARPGEITASIESSGVYVKRESGVTTLDAFALGRQFRYTLDGAQATALAGQLTAGTDGITYVNLPADAFSYTHDDAHSQGD